MATKGKIIKVRLTFFEEVLGTASNDQEIHANYIASKAPDAEKREEEIARIGVDAEIEKGMTVFPRDEHGNPILWDYQIKGFFKETAGFVKKFGSAYATSKFAAHKKKIDGGLFVYANNDPADRQILLRLPEGTEIGNCQRPLRGQTAQGERIALANSETVPAGTTCEFTIFYPHTDISEKMILEWLDYGALKGIGQWRNASKGRFKYEIIK